MTLEADFRTRNDELEAFARKWLCALSEPAALVRTSREIVGVNRAFRRTIAGSDVGKQLDDIFTDSPERLAKYLLACAAAGDPLLGVVHSASGHRFTCRGGRFPLGEQAIVLLRLSEPDERFVRLSKTITELNDLLRQREHEKAQLQEALNDRDIMHRELQHRVKNNLQMLSGLLHAAKTDHEDAAAKAALEQASRHFSAVAAAHQSLYRLDSLRSVDAGPLVSQIADAASLAGEGEVRIDCLVEDIQLPNDLCTPLALVVNELVTNAVKHARIDTGPLVVKVHLAAFDGTAQLDVHDNGSGFHAPSVWKRGSGIGLVRGLVRQLRGKLEFDATQGTLARVTFPLPNAR